MVTAPPVHVCSKCEYAAALPCSTCGNLLCPAHVLFGALHVMCIECLACEAEVPDKEEDTEEDNVPPPCQDPVQAELGNLEVAGGMAVAALGTAAVLYCWCSALLNAG